MVENNLELYKMFYHIAMNRSLTKAAAVLCVSQPAVSQGLKQLETSLGVRLFTRSGKGVRLTGEGEVLFQYVAQGYESIMLGEQKIRQMLNLEHGEIRIGASDMTLEYYLLPYLEQFHQQYPEIKVTVTNAPTPQTISHLKAGRIDFGVITAPIHTEGLEIRPARKVSDIFVAGDRFRYLKGKILKLSDLSSLSLICLEKNTSTRKYMDTFLKKNHVVIEPEFELATSGMIVQFAKRNLGIGAVVSDFAKEALAAGELFALQLDQEIPQRDMLIIRDPNYMLSIAAGKLLAMLGHPVSEGHNDQI